MPLQFPLAQILASKSGSTVIGTIRRPLGLGFWKMEVKRILKEKKFWIASFLVVWAASLQGHMMWLKKQEAFKEKFGDLKFGDLRRDHDPKD